MIEVTREEAILIAEVLGEEMDNWSKFPDEVEEEKEYIETLEDLIERFEKYGYETTAATPNTFVG